MLKCCKVQPEVICGERKVGLSDKRRKFFKIRENCKILVKYHAYGDYPERKFSELEIKNLVKFGSGNITENTSLEAIPDSFLYFPKDDDDRECKLVLLLEEIEIEDSSGTTIKETIIVCSAYREVENET